MVGLYFQIGLGVLLLNLNYLPSSGLGRYNYNFFTCMVINNLKMNHSVQSMLSVSKLWSFKICCRSIHILWVESWRTATLHDLFPVKRSLLFISCHFSRLNRSCYTMWIFFHPFMPRHSCETHNNYVQLLYVIAQCTWDPSYDYTATRLDYLPSDLGRGVLP